MIVYNNDADLEVSDPCVRNSLLSWVELPAVEINSLGYAQRENEAACL